MKSIVVISIYSNVFGKACGDGTLIVSASRRLLWQKTSKCIGVVDGSIGSNESIENVGYIEYCVHTADIPPVK